MNVTFKARPAMVSALDGLCEDLGGVSRSDVVRFGIGLLRSVVEEMKAGGERIVVKGPTAEVTLVMPELEVVRPAPKPRVIAPAPEMAHA